MEILAAGWRSRGYETRSIFVYPEENRTMVAVIWALKCSLHKRIFLELTVKVLSNST